MNMRLCLKKVQLFLRGTFAEPRSSRLPQRKAPHWHRLLIERLEDRITPNAFSAIGQEMQSILGAGGPIQSAMSVVNTSAQAVTDIPFVGGQVGNALTSGTNAVQNLLTPLQNAANELAMGNPTNQQIQDAFLSVVGPSTSTPFLQPIYYNQVGQVSQSSPASGADAVTLTNGSTNVVFSTPQSFATGDSIQLDSDRAGLAAPGPWVQIAQGGTGTSFQLTAPYSGNGGTGAWSRDSLAPPVDNTANMATISTSASVSTVSFANPVTFATGDNFQLDDDGTWYQIATGGTGTSFALTTTYTGSVTSGAWSTVPASPVYVWTTTNGDNISIEMRLVDVFTTSTSIAFNTGLSSLPFAVTANGGIQMSAGFAFELGITSDGSTASLNNNVQLSDAFPPGSSNPATAVVPANNVSLPDANHQFAAFVSATLPQGFSATAVVGFLRGTIKDAGQPSNPDPTTHTALAAEFAVDNLTSSPTAQLIGNADANLALNLGFVTGATSGGENVAFPSVNADFQLAWGLSSNDPNDASSTPKVNFTNVSLDLGTFVSNFLGPIISDLEDALAPVEPVFQVLDKPIPGLSDIGQLIGYGNITLMTIAGLIASNTGYGPLYQLIDAIDEVSTALQNVTVQNGQVALNLGQFDLSGNGNNLFGAAEDPTQADFTGSLDPGNVSPPSTSLDSQLQSDLGGSGASVAISALEKIGAALSNGYQLEFPILTDPGDCIFGMLLGKPSDLVTFTANLNATASSNGIPQLSYVGEGISTFGQITANAHIKIAYDTYGIQQLIQDFVNGNATGPNATSVIATDILDGFYIDDTSSFNVQGQIGIEAGGGIGIASAEVTGGITTGDDGNQPISVTMHDSQDPMNVPDGGSDGGRYRLVNLFTSGDFTQAFNLSGELDASLGITLQIGVNVPLVGFIGYQKNFDIASVTLVDFNPPAPPVLASQPGADGVSGQVTLYVGADAGDRSGQGVNNTDGDTTNGPEVYTITDDGPSNGGDETITVTAYGASQTIDNVASIVGYGDNGDLTVTAGTAQDPMTVPVTLGGGNGHDYLSYTGTQDADLTAGALDSKLVGGMGNNTLTGGNGNDVLIAGSAPSTNHLLAGQNPGSTCYMFAGTGINFMVGGPGMNFYEWAESDGPLQIQGNNPQNIPFNNQLMVTQGPSGGEQWTVSPATQAGVVQIRGTANGARLPVILASGLSTLSIDTPVQVSVAANLAGVPLASINVGTAPGDGGSGYSGTTIPLTIEGGGGSGAAGFATVTNGAISSVTLTNAGSGYTSVPTVSLSGASGSGAQFVVTLPPAASATATEIPVVNPGAIPQTPAGVPIEIDGEQMLVTGFDATTNELIVTRGYDGTKAVAHAAGVPVGTYTADPGGDSYEIDDLNASGTPLVQVVNVNMHESLVPAQFDDTAPDIITVDGAKTDELAQVQSPQFGASLASDANPAGEGTIEQVTLTLLTATRGVSGFGVMTTTYSPEPATAYTIDAAIPIAPNPTTQSAGDTLTVNLYQGNNEVDVDSTAGGGSTFIHTGAGGVGGANTITVGNAGSAQGIDVIQGPLSIDAGNGPNNSLLFTESGAEVGDTLTLTNDALIRCTTTPSVPLYNDYGKLVNHDTRYAFVISYTTDPGGAYQGGIELDATEGFDTVYVPSTPSDPDTTVTVNTEYAQDATTPPTVPEDQVIVGYDAGNRNDQVSASTLDNIVDPLTVLGYGNSTGAPLTGLTIADEDAATGQTYDLSYDVLDRGAAHILFNQGAVNTSLLNLTLDTGPLNNVVNVASTDVDTAPAAGSTLGGTTINCGPGNNLIQVGDKNTLDQILGPLTMNGGAGADSMVLDDKDNGLGQSYTLSGVMNSSGQVTQGSFLRAAKFMIVGNVPFFTPAVNVAYSKLFGVRLEASDNTASGDTDTVAVTGTPAGTHTVVDTFGGTNNVTVTGLAGLQGSLTLPAETGAANSLTVDDSGASTGGTYTITATTLQGQGSQPITYANFAQVGLVPAFDQNAQEEIQGTASGTKYTVGPTNVNNTGSETVNVGDANNTLDELLGPVTLSGTFATHITLTINDQGETQPETYNVYSDHFTRSGAAGTSTIDYGASIVGFTVNGGAGGNQVNVNGDPAEGPATINAGTGPDNVQVSAFSNTAPFFPFTIDGQGNGDSSLSITTTGNYTADLTVQGFPSMQVQVGGDFDGSLLASTEGAAADPIESINVTGTFNGLVKIGFLQSFSVGGNFDGTLKGFGNDPSAPTIQHVTVGGTDFFGTLIEAPSFGTLHFGQDFGGVFNETTPTDFESMEIDGSLLASGAIEAASGGKLTVKGALAGQVIIAGAVGDLAVAGALQSGALIVAASAQTLEVAGAFDGRAVFSGVIGSFIANAGGTGSVVASSIINNSGAHIPIASSLPAVNIAAGDITGLIQAIDTANLIPNLPSTINLAPGSTYVLTAPDNDWYGPNGLPAIAGNITINGDIDPDGSTSTSGAVIERAPGATPFRIFYVSGGDAFDSLPVGQLTLNDLTIEGGLAQGGNGGDGDDPGGGGAGLGGAIFNQGTLNLTAVTLTQNTAQGGKAGLYVANEGAGGGGGGLGSDGGAGDFEGGGGGGGGFATAGTSGTDLVGGTGGAGATGLEGGAGENTAGASPVAQPGSLGGGGGAGLTESAAAGGVGGGGGGAGGMANSGRRFGGNGGFGGGGGGGIDNSAVDQGNGGIGGNGGFGGGGGAAFSSFTSSVFGGGDGESFLLPAPVAGSGAGMGGAIFNMDGSFSATDCTIAMNTALGGQSQALNTAEEGQVQSGGSGLGGAVFNLNGNVILTNDTLAGNDVVGGGSASADADDVYSLAFNVGFPNGNAVTAQVSLTNDILAGASPDDLVSNADSTADSAIVNLAGLNVIQNTTNSLLMGGLNIVNKNPMLGSLQNNGGPTPTMEVLAGSPVLTMPGLNPTSINGVPSADQRGFTRGTTTGLGAYQATTATQFGVTGFAAPNTVVNAGATYLFTLTAEDPLGKTVYGYPGTVEFQVTGDEGGTLPSPSTLTDGVGSFTASIDTTGVQALIAIDKANPSIQGMEVPIVVIGSVPETVAVSSGSPQSTTVGAPFAVPLVALVTDAQNNMPLQGVTVTFTVKPSNNAGGAFGSATTITEVTDASGLATTGVLTANDYAGAFTVSATAGGSSSATFDLTNIPGPPTNLIKIAGDNQTSSIDIAYQAPLEVEVTDAYGNPVGNVPVYFTVPGTGPSGTLGVTIPVNSGSAGIAEAPLTANDDAGTFQVTASLAPAATGPTLTSISPANAPQNNGNVTLTATGTGFVSGSTVDWNGAALPTTFVSSTQLTASIPSADLTSQGTEAVTVVNPDGSTSAAQIFLVNYDSNHPIVEFDSTGESVNTTAGAFSASVTLAPAVGPTVSQFANSSDLPFPTTLASDSSGDFYVLNQFSVTEVAPDRSETTFVSNLPTSEYYGLAVDSAGDVYVGTTLGTVEEITPAKVVTTVASGFEYPSALAFDAAGNLYVADGNTGDVYKVTQQGPVAIASGFDDPDGLAFDPHGNLYVTNADSGTLSKVTTGGAVTLNFASVSEGADGVVCDAAGNIYVVDHGFDIQKVTPTGAVSYLYYLPGNSSSGGGLAIDAAGNLYVTDLDEFSVDKFTTTVSIPFTVGGTATAGADYIDLAPSPLVIPDGQNSATITGFLPSGATAGKTLVFTLSAPSGIELGSPSANTLTITAPPTTVAPVSFTETNAPPPVAAAQLAYAPLGPSGTSPSPPPTSVTVGQLFGFPVYVESANGTIITSDTSTVTATITGPEFPSGGESIPVQVVAGNAIFTGLSFSQTGIYTLMVADPENGGLEAPAPVTINVSLPASQVPASLKIISGNNQSSSLNAAYPSPLVVEVDNAAGNPITTGMYVVQFAWSVAASTSGSTVSFTQPTVTAGANGQASTVATPLGAPGTIGVTASVINLPSGTVAPVSFRLTSTDIPAKITGGGSFQAKVNTDFSTSSPPQVTVTDGSGHGVAGLTVTWGIEAGPNGPIGSPSATFPGVPGSANTLTNASGVASPPTILAGTVAGAWTLFADLAQNITGNPVTFAMTNLAGSFAQLVALSASGQPFDQESQQSTVVATAFKSPLIVEAEDAYGNGVNGVSIKFAAPAATVGVATATLGSTSATTITAMSAAASLGGASLNGIAEVKATANTVASSAAYNVFATATAGSGSSAVTEESSFGLTNTPAGFAKLLYVSGSGQSTVVHAVFGAPLIVLAEDQYNNPLTTLPTVTFAAPTTGASVTFSAASPVNGKPGEIEATATANTIASPATLTSTRTPYTVSASAFTSTGTKITASPSFLLTNTPGTPIVTVSSGSGQTVTAPSAFKSLVAKVVDQYGNPIAATVTFTIDKVNGSYLATFPSNAKTVNAATTSAGLATAPTLTSLVVTGGTFTVTATISGATTSATFNLTVEINDPVVGPSQTTVVGHTFAQALTARVTSPTGRPLAGVPVTFTAPSSGPSGTFAGKLTATVLTNAAGVATAPAFKANTKAGAFAVAVSFGGAAPPEAIRLTNLADPAAHLVALP